MAITTIHTIKKKISDFIKKYYKNQIIRGSLLTTGTVILLYILIVIPESILYLSTTFRKILFFSFVALSLFFIIRWIIIPLLKLFNIKKGISNKEASKIIGKHFPEIDDKLLNLLQLEENAKVIQSDLLLASIEQKAEHLTPFNFKKSVSYKVNLPLIKWVVPLVVFLLIALIFFPGVFVSSAKRVATYNTFYEKPLPFHIYLENNNLKAVQNQSFNFIARVEGEYLPNNLQLILNNDSYQMERDGNIYTFTIDNLSETSSFYFSADEVKSQIYNLEVVPLPVIYEFETKLDYPKYTQKKSELIKNSGDIIVPDGTKVSWKFYTKDVNTISIIFNDSTYIARKNKSNVISFNKQINHSVKYKVLAANLEVTSKDTLVYQIQTIMDSNPKIAVKMFEDSVHYYNRFFSGDISDDYGFSKLEFICKNNDSVLFVNDVDINKENYQYFFYHKDFNFLKDLPEGSSISFYFKVSDNDRVNGYKSAKSQKWILSKPSYEEISQISRKNENEVKNNLEKQLKKSEKVGEELQNLKERMLDKESLNWEEKETMLDLIDEFEAIKKQLYQIKEDLKKNRQFEEQMSDTDQRLLEKQKLLEDLMEKVLDDEMKQLMDEMRELMKDMNKDNFQKKVQDFEMSSKEMEEQINRSLELYKQLKFEKDLDKTIRETKKLKEQQRNLEKKSLEDKYNQNTDKHKEIQDKISSKTDTLHNHLNDLEKQNKALKRKNEYTKPEDELNNAKKAMKQSSQELQNKKSGKASKKMKKASESLEKIENSLSQQLQSMQEKNDQEDAKMLKQILENLIDLSFEQELLMHEFGEIQLNNPNYVPKIQDQFKIKNNLDYVSDSLKALANRQVMIKAHIMGTLKTIDNNIQKSIDYLSSRNVNSGTRFQQEVMMDMNNLALLLSESLDKMNEQSKSSCSKPGSNSCNKPNGNGSKPSMSELKKMQEQMLKQMKQMQKQGQNKGKGNPSNTSEQFARMAAKQSAIRRMMQQYREELIKEGKGDKGLSKTIEKMDKNEEDLINKRLTEDLINRQQDILTRMLESEKAEKEQEKEKKRESEQAINFERSNPNSIDFNKRIDNDKEMLKTVPSSLTPFYKNKVMRYYKNK